MSSRTYFNIGILALLCTLGYLVIIRNDLYADVASMSSRFVGPLSEERSDIVSFSLERLMKGPVVIEQDNPKLIQKIREEFLHYPNISAPYYNLTSNNKEDPSMGQSAKIKELLKNKRDGFFIECGALDGETRSNTLYFEKSQGWKGILVEGDPLNFQKVLSKNRKSIAVSACLSVVPHPTAVMFRQRFNLGKISSLEVGKHSRGHAEVQCLPLYSILLAVNTTEVDYFSLDVEGNELEILKTIPWDKVKIKTLSVEFIHGKGGKDSIREYMERQGYEVYAEVRHAGNLANDFIFYNPMLL